MARKSRGLVAISSVASCQRPSPFPAVRLDHDCHSPLDPHNCFFFFSTRGFWPHCLSTGFFSLTFSWYLTNTELDCDLSVMHLTQNPRVCIQWRRGVNANLDQTLLQASVHGASAKAKRSHVEVRDKPLAVVHPKRPTGSQLRPTALPNNVYADVSHLNTPNATTYCFFTYHPLLHQRQNMSGVD